MANHLITSSGSLLDEQGRLREPGYALRPPFYYDHARIAAWRREQSLRATLRHRPDLLETAPLTDRDRKLLETLRAEDETK